MLKMLTKLRVKNSKKPNTTVFPPRARSEAYLYVGLAVLVWSPIPVMLKLFTGAYTALQINFYIYLFAALGAAFLLVQQGRLGELRKLSFKDAYYLAFAAFIGMVAYDLFLTQSMVFLPSTTANVINYLWPLLMAALAVVLLKERLTWAKGLALLLGFAGVFLLLNSGGLAIEPAGVALAFAGAFFWALFNVLQKKFALEKYSTMMFMVLVAFAVYALFTAYTGSFVAAPPSDLIVFLFLGMFSVTLGITLYLQGLQMRNTVEVASLSFATPFLALLWSNLILGEAIYLQYLVALGLFLVGVVIQHRQAERQQAVY